MAIITATIFYIPTMWQAEQSQALYPPSDWETLAERAIIAISQ